MATITGITNVTQTRPGNHFRKSNSEVLHSIYAAHTPRSKLFQLNGIS